MSEANALPASVETLKKLVQKRQYSDVEAAWMAALDDPAAHIEDLFGILQSLTRRNEPAMVEQLFWFMINTRTERLGAGEALAALRLAAGLPPAKPADAFLPNSESLRKESANLYRAAHPETEPLLGATVLKADMPLAAAVRAVEKLRAFPPGAYVIDGRFAGRVAGVDADTAALAVEFAAGRRNIKVDALDMLKPLSPLDYRARVIFELDALKALAKENAVELVQQVLRAHGPYLKFKEMKAHLAPVVPQSAWAKWWSAARPALKQAPLIQLSDETQPSFGLRAKPISFEDETRAKFNAAASPVDKIATAFSYLNETSGQADAALLGELAAKVAAIAEETRAKHPLCAAACAAVIEKISERGTAAPVPKDICTAITTEAVAVRAMKNAALERLALEYVKRACGDWSDVFRLVMPFLSTEAAEWAAAELASAGHGTLVALAASAIIARPDQSVDAMLWLWKTMASGAPPEYLAGVDRVTLTGRMLTSAESLARKTSSKDSEEKLAQQAIVRTLLLRNGDLMKAALDGAAPDQLKLMRSAIERATGMTDHTKAQLIDAIRHTHPALFAKNVERWEDEVIYTTEAGLKRRQEELYHIVHVKLAEASKAVGTAAADGDLSENFAWTAALAERDRLAGTATRMQSEISKARLITHDMVETERVNVGSAVDAKDPRTGVEKTFLFFGPWDADHDKSIYNYKTPFGVAFMGKKVGDTIEAEIDGESHRWQIQAIKPGI